MRKSTSPAYLASWDDLRFFHSVARLGSFSRAGASLRVKQSTVGRRIHRLERRIGAKLFDRRHDGMRLTPVGREVLGTVETIGDLAGQVERHLTGVDQELDGVVRVAATEGIGAYWLTPRLTGFQAAYPKVVVEVLTGSEVLDLGAREADIAIRLARPTDPRLTAIKVGVIRFALFCSESYIAAHGRPKTLEEVRREHRLVDHIPYVALPFWREFLADKPNVLFRSNSSIAFL
ncbi:MAG: LysR family transcriptional regulator, partial [Alphaproteobacteria bacterium]|nr:LysR family transcriptional regulator [Alphaproteobacteria bacterium]